MSLEGYGCRRSPPPRSGTKVGPLPFEAPPVLQRAQQSRMKCLLSSRLTPPRLAFSLVSPLVSNLSFAHPTRAKTPGGAGRPGFWLEPFPSRQGRACLPATCKQADSGTPEASPPNLIDIRLASGVPRDVLRRCGFRSPRRHPDFRRSSRTGVRKPSSGTSRGPIGAPAGELIRAPLVVAKGPAVTAVRVAKTLRKSLRRGHRPSPRTIPAIIRVPSGRRRVNCRRGVRGWGYLFALSLSSLAVRQAQDEGRQQSRPVAASRGQSRTGERYSRVGRRRRSPQRHPSSPSS